MFRVTVDLVRVDARPHYRLHSRAGRRSTALPVVKKFVDEQVAPGDLVSVMATRSSMGIYEKFTSDKRQLYVAMDRLQR